MITKKSLIVAALGVSATLVAGSALAGGTKYQLCHNIGGPRDLGANCEFTPETPVCAVVTAEGVTINLSENEYLGIIIPLNESSLSAHLAHGDGFVLEEFNPALHLASEIGPHQASNVECRARRAETTQPPEPGN